MRNRLVHGFGWLVLLTLIGACERIVSVEVPEGPVRLVVEGRLEAVTGTPSGRQRIRLTTTAPYFQNSAAPAARGATVTVLDDLGRSVRFAESAAGEYTTDNLVANVGRVYTLRIDWQGDRYEAIDTLFAVAGIDSLYFRPRPNKSAATDGVRATIDLRDPATPKNYYLWDQYVDGVRLVSPDSQVQFRIVASDELYNGRRVRQFQPFDGRPVTSGQDVLVRQYSITEAMYRYYDALNAQADGAGSPFGVPSANVRGNVANLTRPTLRALGYFSASAVWERRARVP